MRVCGIELKGNEAIVCLLSYSNGLFDIPDCRVRSLPIKKSSTSEDVKAFQKAFKQLMIDYKVEHVVIKERPTQGKFAGSALSFKMEAAIQLLNDITVDLMAQVDIKTSLKANPLRVEFSETGLKAFQEEAFVTAFAYLNTLK